jgi:hypothetical protein
LLILKEYRQDSFLLFREAIDVESLVKADGRSARRGRWVDYFDRSNNRNLFPYWRSNFYGANFLLQFFQTFSPDISPDFGVFQ